MSRTVTVCTVLLGCTLLVGCMGRVPFTQNLRSQYNLSNEEVSKLQFYLSHTLVLQRTLSESDRVVNKNHKLVVRSGHKVEEIVVLAGTPGIALDINDQRVHASFEEGSHVVFEASDAHAGRFVLQCKMEGQTCSVALKTKDAEFMFKAIGLGARPFLMIDTSRAHELQRSIKVQKGRRL